jgi:mannose-6-phosphate isomerase-like protein (cupin superfamily)
MHDVKVAKPHYHTGSETEIYFVLSGSGLTVDGDEELPIKAGDVIVTPPEMAHFTIPKENLVMIVINTPPFNLENNIGVDAPNPEVGHDHEQFKKLTADL